MSAQNRLTELRLLSDKLGTSGSAEALATNREILRLVPGDAVASNRLGIALLNTGHYAEAESVLSAALAADPDNRIARNRRTEAHRKLAAPPRPTVTARPSTSRRASGYEPRYWIKSLHYHDDDWTVEPGEDNWISDIGRRGKSGERVYRQDGVEWGEPSWRIGDQIGVYMAGTLKVPVVVEVIAPPEFKPDFVQRSSRGYELDEGERWPWVTRVRGLHAAALDRAPTLDDLGIPHELVQRRPRFTITADQHHRLVSALTRPI